MASFPTSVKSFSARTSGETIAASHINDLQDEVAAIEADLINGLTNTLKPISNDGAALGTSALSWSDLFLASGGVLNFANGNVTITHSANTLTVVGTLAATTFSGSGASLTSIPETGITDGTILARLAANETVTGSWTFTTTGSASTRPILLQNATQTQIDWDKTGGSALRATISNDGTNFLAYDYTNTRTIWSYTPATNAFSIPGTLAWGGGSAISSSSNVGLKNAYGEWSVSQGFGNGVALQGQHTNTNYYTLIMLNGSNLVSIDPSGLGTTMGGVLAVSGFGTHSFSAGGTGANRLTIANTTSGAGNYADVLVSAGTTDTYLRSYSQGYTTSGVDIASSSMLYGAGTGGLTLLAGYGDLRLYSNGTLALTLGASQAATFTGAVSSTSYGTHSFSAGGTWDNEIFIRNTTAGTTARAGIRVGNDNNTGAGQFLALSSTYTTTGPELQDSVILRSLTAGGLSLAAQHASGDLRLYSRGGALALTLGASQLATFTGSIRMTNGYTISWSSDDYRIFRNGDTLRFDQAGVQALLFSGSQAATFAGTLAWGGGSAISSSSNVALLNASNTFTGATQTIDSASTDATLALDSSATGAAQVAYYRNGSYKWSVGAGAANDSPNFQWYNRTGSALRMQLTEEGLLTVSGFGVHSFSAGGTGDIGLRVRNTTAGTGNYANVSIGNDLNPTAGYLLVTSSTWTTSGAFVQNSAIVNSEQAGGLSLSATNASGDVRLYSRNALALTLGASQVASFTGNVRLIASTSDWLEVSNSSNTEKAVYVASNANGTAATAAFRVQNVNYTGWLTLPTATFTTAGLREANVLALVGDAPTLRLGTSHGSGVVQFYSGNTLALTLGASQAASFTGDLSLAATKKLYLDGGGDTYIQEDTGNRLTVVTGGVEGINITSAGIWKTTWSTTAAAANAYVADGSYLLRSTSSIRYKHDIDTLDADHALSAVMAMHPVTYRSKTDDDQRRHVGFIAEEMQTIAPLLATYDEGGETGTPNYVTYDRVTAYLVAVVQKQQAEIDALKAQIKG